ncbi:MAG: aminopeptidase P family protein [Deltaproteobacteria bacterium]|nr:aminopeptidase P family protein [Nannocystaceae bacterium]
MTVSRYTALELSRFREVQQLAYRCAEATAAELRPGVTEKAAAARLGEHLHEAGVRGFFHRPFAWFGDRTCFAGFRTPFDFFPSDRALEPGMAAILDVAPVVEGYACDIGYSFACGENPELERLREDLQGFRALILELALRGETLAEIYRGVEDMLADLGVRNCHRHYPFGVLAHRVYHQPPVPLGQRPVLGFGLTAGLGLLAQKLVARLPVPIAARLPGLQQGSPFCNTGPGSDARPEPGLWAFEPHIARGDIGAKWEELLVIEERRVFWLDDDLPHVRAWQQQGTRRVANG